MKKASISAVLVIAIALLAIGCDDGPEEVRPDKPTSLVKLRGQETDTHPTNGLIKWSEWDSVFVIPGPGSFISALVSRKGGTPNRTDKTTVRLSIDRKDISLQSFEVARAMGLSRQNYSGVVWLEGENDEGDVETMVLGFVEPLYFEEILLVSVRVDSTIDDVGDNRVTKLFASIVYTKKNTGDDEDTGGGDNQPQFP